jgi:tetraspanin-13/31
MIILFLLFLVQFAVACACLALSDYQQQELYKAGWSKASYDLKKSTQEVFDCCGYNVSTQDLVVQRGDDQHEFGHPTCEKVCFCTFLW